MNLALDIAPAQAGAAWSDGGTPSFSSFSAGASIKGEVGSGRDYGPMAAAYEAWLIALINTVKPGRLCYEAPMQVVKEKKPGERIKTNQATVIALLGLAVVTDKVAFQLKVPRFQIHAGTARAKFCGDGHAKKPAIYAQCHRIGWRPKNFDESDAGCVLYAMLTLDPKFRLQGDVRIWSLI